MPCAAQPCGQASTAVGACFLPYAGRLPTSNYKSLHDQLSHGHSSNTEETKPPDLIPASRFYLYSVYAILIMIFLSYVTAVLVGKDKEHSGDTEPAYTRDLS